MPLASHVNPRIEQPQEGWQINRDRWPHVAASFVGSLGYITTDGSLPTQIGAGSTHQIVDGPGGQAFGKTVSASYFRSRYPHPNRDSPNSSVIGLLVQFRLTPGLLQNLQPIASLGSDVGESGNTLHTVAVDNTGQIHALAGSRGTNPGWSPSGVSAEVGRTYTVLTESLVSLGGFSIQNRFWINGRRWALESHGGLGGPLPYDWLCVLGGRRTTDFGGERLAEVLTASAFVWPATGAFFLTEDEAAELSSNPWTLYEPQRIWVPVNVGTSTTPVNNDQLISYVVRSTVQQDRLLSYAALSTAQNDRSLDYLVRSTAQNDRNLDYLVRSAVQSDRNLSYTLEGVPGFNGQAFDPVAFYANAPLAQVLSELQLSYTTRAGVTNDRLLNYNVLSSVSNDRNLDYLVRSSAQQDLLQSYLVRSAVARDLGINYLLRNAVLGNLGISYSVLTSAQNDRSLDYLVRSAVTQNQNLSYPVAGAVTSSVALDYLVRAAVSQDRNLAWSIFQAGVVTNDLLLNYGIAGSVAQNQSLNYLVRASVAQNQGLNYNILTSAAQNLSLNYLVRAGVIQDRLLSYGIAGAMTSDLPLNWATRVAVAQNQGLTYSVLTSVTADRQVSYAVRAAIARELEVTYGIRSAVAQNLALNYQVFMSVPVAQNLSLAWAVFQSDGSVGLEQILLKSPITLLVQYPSHISPTISLKSPVR